MIDDPAVVVELVIVVVEFAEGIDVDRRFDVELEGLMSERVVADPREIDQRVAG